MTTVILHAPIAAVTVVTFSLTTARRGARCRWSIAMMTDEKDILRRCGFLCLHYCRDSHAENLVKCDDVYVSGGLAKNTGTVAPRRAKEVGPCYLKQL